MKLNITSQNENPILKRKEIEAELVFTGATPSAKEVVADIARQIKVDAELVELVKIDTIFGSQTGKVTAYAYQDKETKAEMKGVNKKQAEKEKKEADAAKPAEEKPAEAPKEEPKAEEAPKEEASEAPKEEAPAEEKKDDLNTEKS